MTISLQIFMTGRCQARCFSPASCPRDEWPTACSWHPGEKQHPPLSMLSPWERTHTGGGFPCASVSCTLLPKPVEWLPVASVCQIAAILVNAGTFLRTTLRAATRTFFSLQGTPDLFSHRHQKVETARVKTVRVTRLTTAIESGMACGGFRTVRFTRSINALLSRPERPNPCKVAARRASVPRRMTWVTRTNPAISIAFLHLTVDQPSRHLPSKGFAPTTTHLEPLT
jgi:hypothetical protein